MICPLLTKCRCPGSVMPPPSKLTATLASESGRYGVDAAAVVSDRLLPKIVMYDPGSTP